MNDPHSTSERSGTAQDPNAVSATEPLREGIEQTRVNIAETISALETKLSPSELKDKLGIEAQHLEAKVRELSRELLTEARVVVKEELGEASTLLRHEIGEVEAKLRTGLSQARDTVKEDLQQAITRAKQSARAATVGRVEDLATSVGDVMNETRDTLIDTIRYNPIPAALAGVGLAWLLMNRSSSASRNRGYASGHVPGPHSGVGHDPARSFGSLANQASDTVSHAARGIANTTSNAFAQAGEVAHHAGESAGAALQGAVAAAGNVTGQAVHAASQFAHDASNVASNTLDGAWSQARRVERGLESTLRDSPLAMGAAVLVAGAALGFALPRTKSEDALMGQSRDRLIEGAEAVVHGAVEAVGHVTEQTGDAAKRAIESAVQAS